MRAWNLRRLADMIQAHKGGEGVAPTGEASDTRPGLEQPGPPPPDPVRVTYCMECRFCAPFPLTLPCPRCGHYPKGKDGRTDHLTRLAVHRSLSVWWKPQTWGTCVWEPLPITDERERLRFALRQAEHDLRRFRRQTKLAQVEVETLTEAVREFERAWMGGLLDGTQGSPGGGLAGRGSGTPQPA